MHIYTYIHTSGLPGDPRALLHNNTTRNIMNRTTHTNNKPIDTFNDNTHTKSQQ